MAKKLVVHGAKLKCSQGSSPSSLVIAPGVADIAGKPTATILDHVPMKNVQPFGMCKSPANPQVAAATAAAMGVLTPQPCVPVVPAPWSPGSGVSSIEDTKLLTDDSKCSCTWAGEISITDPATDVDTD